MRALAATFVALVTLSRAAQAQQIGYWFDVIVPVVVDSPSYASQVFIHNPGASSASISVDYNGATGSATPGPLHCPAVAIPAGNVIRASLGELWPSLDPGSNFGSLDLSGSMITATRACRRRRATAFRSRRSATSTAPAA